MTPVRPDKHDSCVGPRAAVQTFLRDTLGDDWHRSVSEDWTTVLSPTRDQRFVDGLRRGFRGIPLSASDMTSLSFNTSGPRVFAVACGLLTLVCVVGPRNGAADECAFLPLWASLDAASESPPWLFTFDVAAVIRAIEDLIRRHRL